MSLTSNEQRQAILSAPKGARVTLDDVSEVDFTIYEVGLSSRYAEINPYAVAFRDACRRKSECNIGRALPDDTMCSSCVYSLTVSGIYLHSDGRCNMCHAFERSKVRAEEAGTLDRERTDMLATASASGKDAILAFSGGKDSSATLEYLANETDLNVRAMLVQNGFIPDAVVDLCKGICADLSVPFEVLEMDFREPVKQVAAGNLSIGYPCEACSQGFRTLISKRALELGIRRIIMGRNFWARLEPELTGVTHFQLSEGEFADWYCLPFLQNWTERGLAPRLARIGWEKRVDGDLSTNCLVPSLVAPAYGMVGKTNPETALFAHEVICGFMTREEALEHLSAPPVHD